MKFNIKMLYKRHCKLPIRLSVKIAPNFVFKPLFIIFHEIWIQFYPAFHLIQKILLAYNIMKPLIFIIVIFGRGSRFCFVLLLLFLIRWIFVCAQIVLLIVAFFGSTLRILIWIIGAIFLILILVEELFIILIVEICVELTDLLLSEPLFFFFDWLITIHTSDATLFLSLPAEPVVQLAQFDVLIYGWDNLHVVLSPVLWNVPNLYLYDLGSIFAQVLPIKLVDELLHDQTSFVLD